MARLSDTARIAVAVIVTLLGVCHAATTFKFCDEASAKEYAYNPPPERLIAPRRDCNHIKHSSPQRCIYRPPGSRLASIPVGNTGSSTGKLAVFMPDEVDAATVEHAIIIVAGKLSNAGQYWRRLQNVTALHAARPDKMRRKTISVAPLLFSDRYTPGLHGEEHLSWSSPRAWIAGAAANSPPGSNTTSIDALEALADEFACSGKYPLLTNVTFVGQSAGGQLVQRYAALARDRPSCGAHVRYVQNNPATCSYFTADRPSSVQGKALPPARSCAESNLWPFGFDDFPGTAAGTLTPVDYFRQYASRDVVATVGYRDTNPCSGDQACQAVLQGGHKRRDRNLIWYRYVHELARTGENLTGFPGTFGDLPDWGPASENRVGLRLALAKDAGHEFAQIFSTPVGQSALFDDVDVLEGWRPGK
ncbi:putative transmembrane protein [Metarhizium anisopliae]